MRIKPITVGTSNFNQPPRVCVPVCSVINSPLLLELDEEGTRISLTIVDTPGFGDQIDNEAR